MTNDNTNQTLEQAYDIPVNRFDFTQTERDLMNLAVELDILDGVELGILIAHHGANFTPINDFIIECAFAARHSDPAKSNTYASAANLYQS